MSLQKIKSNKFKSLETSQMENISGGRKYWKNVGTADGGNGHTYYVYEQWSSNWIFADTPVAGTRTFGDAPQQAD